MSASADDKTRKDAGTDRPADRQQSPSMLTPTFMQAITNLRQAAKSLQDINAAGQKSETIEAGGGDEQPERAGANGASRLAVDAAHTVESELLKPAPRDLQPSVLSRHNHFTFLVAVPILVGVACLSLFAFDVVSKPAPYPLEWLIAAITALGLAAVLNPGLHCQCGFAKWLVRQGTGVAGQICEKRVVARAGKRQYFLDYAFNAGGSTALGSMQVSARQFESVAEGDVLTVVYVQTQEGAESCLYRFSPFQAVP